ACFRIDDCRPARPQVKRLDAQLTAAKLLPAYLPHMPLKRTTTRKQEGIGTLHSFRYLERGRQAFILRKLEVGQVNAFGRQQALQVSGGNSRMRPLPNKTQQVSGPQARAIRAAKHQCSLEGVARDQP